MTAPAPNDIAVAPAPWKVECENYWFPIWLPKQLPEGIYDPLEASSEAFSSSAISGKFTAGLGMIQIYRYSKTPVGPYDEIIFIPGNFDVPGRGERLRITRSYVSQRDTTYNGRVHWNIPKHLAHFSFSSSAGSSPSSLTIAIYAPDPSATTPFFAATLTPFRLVPPVPFSTKYMPLSTKIAQPPLPAASPESKDADVIVSTDRWAEFSVEAYASRLRGCWVEVHTPKRGSDEETEALKWWPVTVKPYRVGLWMENAGAIIPSPTTWS